MATKKTPFKKAQSALKGKTTKSKVDAAERKATRNPRPKPKPKAKPAPKKNVRKSVAKDFWSQ